MKIDIRFLAELETRGQLYIAHHFVKRRKRDHIFVDMGNHPGYTKPWGASCLLVEKLINGVILTCQNEEDNSLLAQSISYRGHGTGVPVKQINWFKI